MAFSTPLGRLWTPFPLSHSLYGQAGGRTDGQTYADVTTKIFRIDWLSNPPTHALAGSAITHGAPCYGYGALLGRARAEAPL